MRNSLVPHDWAGRDAVSLADIALHSGFSVPQVRRCEAEGLIAPLRRGPNGRHLMPKDTAVELLAVASAAKAAGVALACAIRVARALRDVNGSDARHKAA